MTEAISGSQPPNNKKYEYQRLSELTLYFLDYRLKMFGVFIALNGVGLTAVLAQKRIAAAVTLSLFILTVSIVGSLLGVRANSLAYKYRKVAHTFERDLGMTEIYELHKETLSDRPSMGMLFLWLYRLIIFLWIVIIVLLLLVSPDLLVNHVK